MKPKLLALLPAVFLSLTAAVANISSRGTDTVGDGILGIKQIDSPAKPGSGEPNLYVANDGRNFLTWIEPMNEKRRALRFSIRQGDGWSSPRTIAEGENWFVNWADFPALAVLSDGSLVAHWLTKNGSNAEGYDINIARSTDGGQTWGKAIKPHSDGTETEHGFVSLLPLRNGRVGVVWLDGRNFKGNGSHDAHSLANEMTLRYATLGSNGQLSDEAQLDSRVCDCCQTAAAVTSDGIIVAYRDRSKDEIRDISVVRLQKGRWTEPTTVNGDGWQINGCPVNGPAIVANGRQVAVAWFTDGKNASRVNVAFSNDGGATFNKPIQVDDGRSGGRVDVLLLPDGAALVSWMERVEKGAEIRVRRVQPSGDRGTATVVAVTTSARASGFPRMKRAANEIIFAWTEAGNPSQVRTAIALLAGFK